MRDEWAEFDDAPGSVDPWSEFGDTPARPKAGRNAAPPVLTNPTGNVIDGDTLRTQKGSARLYGVDAYELDQTGRKRDGTVIPVGQQAKGAFDTLVTPDSALTVQGKPSYGRPVVSVDTRGTDAGRSMLDQGLGIAVPRYLQRNARLGDYMEAERRARMNLRGAHATDAIDPAAHRNQPLAPRETVAVGGWEEKPFAGLKPEIERAYIDVTSDLDSTAGDILSFAEANGFQLNPEDVRKFVAERNEAGESGNTVTYVSKPVPMIDPGDGGVGAGARGVGDTILFGGLDEAGAVVDTLGLTPGRENIWSSDRGALDIWRNNQAQNSAILNYDSVYHPYAQLGGQIAGAFVIPYGSGIRSARGLAGLGAAEGGAYAFGSTDGGVGERLSEVPKGAAIGAGLGYGLGKGVEIVLPRITRKASGRDNGRLPTDGPDGSPNRDAAQPAISASEDSAAAMRADDDALTVRQPDRIDVSRPRRLADTEAQSVARMQDVRPGDVVPLPSNEVRSMDEAASISEGMRPPVNAPDERSVLGTRRFPSNRNPDRLLPRKGPLDLVSWVRAQGGLRDQGGELSFFADNAARDMDFTQAERRLGPFIDDNGATLDDMALRAWEEGYFPDHVERPTVNEFLDALEETYTGANRSFHPDDLDEVDSFNAARETRIAVERADSEGAPLIEELGQPATLDDQIANTPPISAYEEWPEGVSEQIGNIDVRKLDSPQDINRALRASHDRVGGFDAATRGRITQAETERLADELGMTADDLLSRRKGEAFNAEEALAARRILAKSGNELVNLARSLQRSAQPGHEQLAAFREAWVRHVAIQEQIAGATAEAGRTLQQFRMAANSRDHSANVLRGLVGSGGGDKNIMETANRILDFVEDPARLNRFSADAMKPKFKDKVVELWYNWLLSGPQTHAVNMASNTLTAFAQLPEHALAAGLGSIRRAAAQDEVDRVLFSELGARSVGMLQGAKEGLAQAARTFRTGEPSDVVTKVDDLAHKAISGRKGELLRIPTRLLAAEDEFFKAVARRMELTGLAVRQARTEGLKGQEAKERAAELVANPTDEMLQRSLDYGRYLTFTRPLGSVGSKVTAITQEMPIWKAVVPFIRTPTNLLKFTFERSPLAGVMKEWRKEFMAGGARRDLAVARAMIGSAFGAMMAEAAANGIITGAPPSDANRARLLRANGWQPYSIKVGDTYYSYQRLDPFASTIGVAADLATMGEGLSESQRDNAAVLLTASIMNNLANKTWLSGLTDVGNAITDPARYAWQWLKRLAGSATVPAGVAQVSRTVDPTFRDTDTMPDYIRSRIPGLSQSLPARYDIWGREIVGEGGLGPDIVSPIWESTDRDDPVTQEMLKLGVVIGRLNRDDRTPEEFADYSRRAGQLMRERVEDLMMSPTYETMSREAKVKAINKIKVATRKEAREGVDDYPGRDAKTPDAWDEFQDAPQKGKGDEWDEFSDPPQDDVLGKLQSSIPGIRVTSGYRDEAYQADMRRRGYSPARNSAHLHGSALDLLPPPGRSMSWLKGQVQNAYPNAQLLNEGDHLHAVFPGWYGAPALGGARLAGLSNPMVGQ